MRKHALDLDVCANHNDTKPLVGHDRKRERTRAEAALRGIEGKLRAILDKVPSPIAMIDLQDNKILFWSHNAQVLFGYPTPQNIVEWFEEAYPDPEYRQNAIAQWEPLVEKARQFGPIVNAGEYLINCADGTVRLCALSVSCIDNDNLIITFNDITERKKAEDELRESGKRYRELFDNANLSIFQTAADGKILAVNHEFARMFGFATPEEVLGSLNDAAAVFADQTRRQEIIDMLIDNPDQTSFESLYRRKDGSCFWGKLNVRHIADLSGSPHYLEGFIEDISERKQGEEKIKSLLAEKELLLNETIHRVKNNMATVASLLSLQSGIAGDPSVSAALDEAEGRVRSMLLLYQKMSQVSHLNEISVNDYLSSLVDDIARTIQVRLPIEIHKNIGDFILDSKKLSYLGIIANELLTNIAKHAFRDRNNGEFWVSVSLNESLVVFVIQDNGVGMPNSVNFETSPGFGLMLIGTLVKQLNGTIRIERKNGTTIIIEFPR